MNKVRKDNRKDLIELVDKAIMPLMELSDHLWREMKNRLDINVNAGRFVWVPDEDPQWIEKTELSQTRDDLLRELLEEMPKKKLIVGIPTEPEGNLVQDMINLRSLSQVESFNEALDQVNTILEGKLLTVKK